MLPRLQALFPLLALFLLLPLASGAKRADGALAAGPGEPPAALVTLDAEEILTLPPGRPAAVNVTVRYCNVEGGLPSGPREVALATEGEASWLSVEFDPAMFVFPAVLPGECDEGRGLMRLNATPEAPAWEITRFRLVAENPATRWRYASEEYVLKVGYHGDLRADPTEAEVTARAGEVTSFPVQIRNRGNAETKFMLVGAGDVPGLQLVLPGPLILAPGETATWEVGVLPKEDRGRLEADLLVTSHAYQDHSALGASEILHVEVQTLPKLPLARFPTPGPLAAVFAALLAAALLGTETGVLPSKKARGRGRSGALGEEGKA